MRIPQPGDVLAGKYRLDEVLGEGGFGVVVLATTRDTGRPVAVKILKPQAGGYEMAKAARFLREMATIAQLESPHTLTLYDYGKTDDGVLFMVCEYVDGEDLLALIGRRTRLEEHEVAWIIYQVLQSLAEAHELGVLHRDIKPSNIRIFRYQKDPLRVKVLDFGLAKAIEPGAQAKLTGTNKAIGTPRYMAPEQLIGAPLSPATDLYQVGLVTAEMLLGREATTLRSPSERLLDISGTPDLSDAMRDVLIGLLAPDPSERPQSAAEVMARLRPLRRREVPQPAPAPPPPPAKPIDVREHPAPARDNRTLVRVAVALLLLIVMLATVLLSIVRSAPETPPPRRSELGGLVRQPDPGRAVVVEQIDPPDLAAPPTTTAVPAGCGREPAELIHAHVFAPEQYESSEPHSVVIWLKADQDDGLRVPSSDSFRRLIEHENVIVIVPRGASRGDWRADQLSEVSSAVDEVRSQYCVDDIFVFSSGGAGNLAMALSCQPWVSGVAISNFSHPPADLNLCGPTLWLAARESNYVPIAGGASCVSVLPRMRDLRPHAKIEEELRELSKCRGPAQKTEPVRHVTCQTWECETPLQSCLVDGGFGWPGAPSPPAVKAANIVGCSEPPPSRFDAAAHAWKFFEEHRQSAGPGDADAAHPR